VTLDGADRQVTSGDVFEPGIVMEGGAVDFQWHRAHDDVVPAEPQSQP
jgi:hypothetical protein